MHQMEKRIRHLWGALMIAAMLLSPAYGEENWTQATGGTVHAYRDADGELWQAHIFTEIGTNDFTITQGGEVEYLIVGGGGGGASSLEGPDGGGGGGGAGGMIVGTNTVEAGSHPVVVGYGGGTIDDPVVQDLLAELAAAPAAIDYDAEEAGDEDGSGDVPLVGVSDDVPLVDQLKEPGSAGLNGGDSSVFNLVALGGGGGAGTFKESGRAGGSGGAGANSARGDQPGDGGAGLQPDSEWGGLGHKGGRGTDRPRHFGSGGGGAGGPGERSWFRGGNEGGAGVASDITGKSVTYARGGNGGIRAQVARGADGLRNSGNGGGGGDGGRHRRWVRGGNGGSGIVVVRYKLPPPEPMRAEGGIVFDFTDDDGVTWRLHTFKTSSSFTVQESGFVEFALVGGGGGGSTAHEQIAPGGAGGAVWIGGTAVEAGQAFHIFVGRGGPGAPLSGRAENGGNGEPSSAFGVSAAGGRGGVPHRAAPVGGKGAGGDSEDANGGPGGGLLITDSSQPFGGGGGSALAENGPGKGMHGGGNASIDGNPGKAGAPNTGGGGGGGNNGFPGGGDGGSGIVVVRYMLAD